MESTKKLEKKPSINRSAGRLPSRTFSFRSEMVRPSVGLYRVFRYRVFFCVCVCVCVAAGVGWRQRRSADPAGSDPGNEASLNETSDRPRLICMLICIDFAPRRTAVPDFSIRFSFLFSFFLFLFLFVLPSNWVCDLNGSHRGMQSFRVGAFRLRTRGAAGKKKKRTLAPINGRRPKPGKNSVSFYVIASTQ